MRSCESRSFSGRRYAHQSTFLFCPRLPPGLGRIEALLLLGHPPLPSTPLLLCSYAVANPHAVPATSPQIRLQPELEPFAPIIKRCWNHMPGDRPEMSEVAANIEHDCLPSKTRPAVAVCHAIA